MKYKNKKFVIECEMNERWIPHFLSMIKYMEQLGGLGGSRKVSFYSDGDGDFRPKFTFDSELLPEVKKPSVDNDGDRLYDAGGTMSSFYIEFKYDGSLGQTNPYHILDGDWMNGTWVRGIDTKNPKNVFEISEKVDKEAKLLRKWYSRVWDDGDKKWRELTEVEKQKYKISDEIWVEPNFDNISIPEIKYKDNNKFDMRDILLSPSMKE